MNCLDEVADDLALNAPFVKGRDWPVRNCWHFSSDGNFVDAIFLSDEDFRDGMNRIYAVFKNFRITILAFALMDTHFHFVLYGEYSECNKFVHEYSRRTSQYISDKYGDRNKLVNVPIRHQVVDDDFYLKIVICYTIRNATVAGLPFTPYDYPWSSGTLYFRSLGSWTSPAWMSGNVVTVEDLKPTCRRDTFRTKEPIDSNVRVMGDLIFPGEYVDCKLVERIFKTARSFNWFMGKCKEDDVESRGGAISNLSIPMQEMRQNKNELCQNMFGVKSVRNLDTLQRMRLARALRAKYNCSLKQVVRLVGLVYGEVKEML